MKRCPRKGCKADMSLLRSDAVWCSRKCYMTVKRDPSAYRAPTRTPHPGGPQVSYRKAVDEVAFLLTHVVPLDAERATTLAESALRNALPERQR